MTAQEESDFDAAVNGIIDRVVPMLSGEALGVGMMALQNLIVEAFGFVEAVQRDEAIRSHIAVLLEAYPTARTQ